MEEDLVLYYYGELESAGRTRVEAHTVSCEPCRLYLQEIQCILPLTAAGTDEPPEVFWSAYSRELRHKLDALDESGAWWQRLTSYLKPWALPAFAATAVIAVAIGFTVSRGVIQPGDVPATDRALIEALPVAEKLDFFSNMEMLDSMELLESVASTNGNV
jgi:hypothetical protein